MNKSAVINFLEANGYKITHVDEEYVNLSEGGKEISFGVSVSDDEVVFITDEGDFFHLPLKSHHFEFTLLGAMIQFKMITVNYNWYWVDTESPEIRWQYEVDEVGGKHGEGLGVNPNGVNCGECCRNTCKGCEHEHVGREDQMKDKTRETIRSTIKSKNFTDEEKTAFFIDFIKCYADKISDLEQKESEKIEKVKEILKKLLEYLED